MRVMVIGALLIGLAGCGRDAATVRVQAPASRPQAREMVYLYRVSGDDPLPDSIRLRADGTADIRRGGGAAGINWIKAVLSRHETARAARLVDRAPWKALDGRTVVPGGFGGWNNYTTYMLRRGRWSIAVTDAHMPPRLRPLIRELDAIIENDKGRRLSSLLIARGQSVPTVGR